MSIGDYCITVAYSLQSLFGAPPFGCAYLTTLDCTGAQPSEWMGRSCYCSTVGRSYHISLIDCQCLLCSVA